jgi:pSer/pThr/pTyr-binding forkhead associated (FHA) protein
MMSTARYGQHQTYNGWGARPDIATAASKEQRVTEKDHNSGADQSEDVTVETTSVFRADFLNELDAPPAAGAEGAVSGVEGLPAGSALLVVKRGPNAGSRFLLDQPTTSAGRHPDSDIFLDDVTVSRRHAEFRLESGEFQVVDVGSLNGTYVNREPVDSSELQNGDEVQIGKFRLVFLTGPRVESSDSSAGAGSL